MSTLDSLDYIDPKTVPTAPTAWRYGLIGGMISIVLSLVFMMTGMIDYTGQSSNAIPNILSTLVTVGVLFMGIKHHKDNDLGGYLTIGRGVKVGVAIGLIMALLSAVFMYLYFTFVEPDFFSNMMEMMREQFEDQGMADDQIDATMGVMTKMMSPVGFAMMAIIGSLFSSLIISLIISAIIKKNPPTAV